MRHVFVRHPPMPALRGRCYGRLDAPLPGVAFERAARLVAPQLPPWPITSSPRLRCIGLAGALLAMQRQAGIGSVDRVQVDARWQELDFGEWEGRPWSTLPRDALEAWSRDIAGYTMPGGESFLDLIARVRDALAALDAPHVIVAHAGTIRAALHLAGMPLAQAAGASIAHAQPVWIDVA
jgi:alpha-ribazole phosphatase